MILKKELVFIDITEHIHNTKYDYQRNKSQFCFLFNQCSFSISMNKSCTNSSSTTSILYDEIEIFNINH